MREALIKRTAQYEVSLCCCHIRVRVESEVSGDLDIDVSLRMDACPGLVWITPAIPAAFHSYPPTQSAVKVEVLGRSVDQPEPSV